MVPQTVQELIACNIAYLDDLGELLRISDSGSFHSIVSQLYNAHSQLTPDHFTSWVLKVQSLYASYINLFDDIQSPGPIYAAPLIKLDHLAQVLSNQPDANHGLQSLYRSLALQAHRRLVLVPRRTSSLDQSNKVAYTSVRNFDTLEPVSYSLGGAQLPMPTHVTMTLLHPRDKWTDVAVEAFVTSTELILCKSDNVSKELLFPPFRTGDLYLSDSARYNELALMCCRCERPKRIILRSESGIPQKFSEAIGQIFNRPDIARTMHRSRSRRSSRRISRVSSHSSQNSIGLGISFLDSQGPDLSLRPFSMNFSSVSLDSNEDTQSMNDELLNPQVSEDGSHASRPLSATLDLALTRSCTPTLSSSGKRSGRDSPTKSIISKTPKEKRTSILYTLAAKVLATPPPACPLPSPNPGALSNNPETSSDPEGLSECELPAQPSYSPPPPPSDIAPASPANSSPILSSPMPSIVNDAINAPQNPRSPEMRPDAEEGDKEEDYNMELNETDMRDDEKVENDNVDIKEIAEGNNGSKGDLRDGDRELNETESQNNFQSNESKQTRKLSWGFKSLSNKLKKKKSLKSLHSPATAPSEFESSQTPKTPQIAEMECAPVTPPSPPSSEKETEQEGNKYVPFQNFSNVSGTIVANRLSTVQEYDENDDRQMLTPPASPPREDAKEALEDNTMKDEPMAISDNESSASTAYMSATMSTSTSSSSICTAVYAESNNSTVETGKTQFSSSYSLRSLDKVIVEGTNKPDNKGGKINLYSGPSRISQWNSNQWVPFRRGHFKIEVTVSGEGGHIYARLVEDDSGNGPAICFFLTPATEIRKSTSQDVQVKLNARTIMFRLSTKQEADQFYEAVQMSRREVGDQPLLYAPTPVRAIRPPSSFHSIESGPGSPASLRTYPSLSSLNTSLRVPPSLVGGSSACSSPSISSGASPKIVASPFGEQPELGLLLLNRHPCSWYRKQPTGVWGTEIKVRISVFSVHDSSCKRLYVVDDWGNVVFQDSLEPSSFEKYGKTDILIRQGEGDAEAGFCLRLKKEKHVRTVHELLSTQR
uniref:ARAD1D32846p n=1 Tax=Blastobotrys adeninivorans TaxID=409370 RepID=A0A060TGR5_BLAAD